MKKPAVAQEFILTSPQQTKNFAQNLAIRFLKFPAMKKAVVLGMVGGLGEGKTTFVQGFAKGFGIQEKILSPTFVILKRFKVKNPTAGRFNNLYHLDCYRLKNSQDLSTLNFKEIVTNPKNIVCVEWADNLKKSMPPETFWLKFYFIDKTTRKITISSPLTKYLPK